MTGNTPTEKKQTLGVSLGQRRANDAWQRIATLKKDFEDDQSAQKDYAIEAKKLPIRIKASGLGQALAFISAKAKKSKKSKKSGPALEKLLNDLSNWVLIQRKLPWDPGDPEGNTERPTNLLSAVIEGNTGFLRWSTDEVMTYLQWLNRFLEAEIDFDLTNN